MVREISSESTYYFLYLRIHLIRNLTRGMLCTFFLSSIWYCRIKFTKGLKKIKKLCWINILLIFVMSGRHPYLANVF